MAPSVGVMKQIKYTHCKCFGILKGRVLAQTETDTQHSIAFKNVSEPWLLKVRKYGSCKREDCKDKAMQKNLKTNETENYCIKKRMHRQLHMDFEYNSEKMIAMND